MFLFRLWISLVRTLGHNKNPALTFGHDGNDWLVIASSSVKFVWQHVITPLSGRTCVPKRTAPEFQSVSSVLQRIFRLVII